MVYLLDMPPKPLSFIITGAFFAILPLGIRVFFLESGMQLRAMGRFQSALRRFKIFLSFYSKEEARFHEIQLEIADTYYRMNEMELAEKHLKQVDAERMLKQKKRPKYCRLYGLLALQNKQDLEEVRDYFVMSLEETKELLPYVMYQYFDVFLGKEMDKERFADGISRKFQDMTETLFLSVIQESSLKKARSSVPWKVRKLLPVDVFEWEMLQFYSGKLYGLMKEFKEEEEILKKKLGHTEFLEAKKRR